MLYKKDEEIKEFKEKIRTLKNEIIDLKVNTNSEEIKNLKIENHKLSLTIEENLKKTISEREESTRQIDELISEQLIFRSKMLSEVSSFDTKQFKLQKEIKNLNSVLNLYKLQADKYNLSQYSLS